MSQEWIKYIEDDKKDSRCLNCYISCLLSCLSIVKRQCYLNCCTYPNATQPKGKRTEDWDGGHSSSTAAHTDWRRQGARRSSPSHAQVSRCCNNSWTNVAWNIGLNYDENPPAHPRIKATGEKDVSILALLFSFSEVTLVHRPHWEMHYKTIGTCIQVLVWRE